MKGQPKSVVGSVELDSDESLDPVWQSYWNDPTPERRNRLVVAYQVLVRRMVGRFCAKLPRTVDPGDLTTAANVGLMDAISNYDPDRQVRFEVYAEHRIRGALLDELRSEDWLPRPWRQRQEQHKRTLESLRSRLEREPYDHEVAEELGLRFDEYESLYGVRLPSAPGGSGNDWEDEYGAGLDVVPDPRAALPSDSLTRVELTRLMAQRMTEQEYRIVYLKYWEELPMREIGLLTDLSESRVCKIHSRLMERLKDRFQSE